MTQMKIFRNFSLIFLLLFVSTGCNENQTNKLPTDVKTDEGTYLWGFSDNLSDTNINKSVNLANEIDGAQLVNVTNQFATGIGTDTTINLSHLRFWFTLTHGDIEVNGAFCFQGPNLVGGSLHGDELVDIFEDPANTDANVRLQVLFFSGCASNHFNRLCHDLDENNNLIRVDDLDKWLNTLNPKYYIGWDNTIFEINAANAVNTFVTKLHAHKGTYQNGEFNVAVIRDAFHLAREHSSDISTLQMTRRP